MLGVTGTLSLYPDADFWALTRGGSNMDKSGVCLITCIVERGRAEKVVNAAMNAGAEGATIYYGRGVGVRQKIGWKGLLVKPEKEVILIATKGEETNKVFDAVVESANLNKPGNGFAFLHRIDRAVGFL